MNLKDRVQKLKSSFSVEGVPLIYTDRFSKEELDDIKSNTDAHSSHWTHIKDNITQWTDEEIGDQIKLFMSINLIKQNDFNNFVNNFLKRLPFKNKESELKNFIRVLKITLQIEDCVDVNREFWRNFGSAPYYINRSNNNQKLNKYQKLYGACGMNEIFGEERFSIAYHLIHAIENSVDRFNQEWSVHQEIVAMQTLHSDYKSLDDLEGSVVVKQMYDEARKFYHDKSKGFDERLKVFSKYGDDQSDVFSPNNSDLSAIFDWHIDGDMYQRHEIVDTVNIIECWIDDLSHKRCKLDWTNEYHAKLIQTDRNYKPSQAAIDRLKKYYLEKLMLEEVRCFELDW